jgi:thymidylate synthase
MVRSVFGRSLRFDFKQGFPILTTKKVFTRGIIHELLWFLKKTDGRSMNIKYLVENGINIWTDDAYRWFKTWVKTNIVDTKSNFHYYKLIDGQEVWCELNDIEANDYDVLINMPKEEFVANCLNQWVIKIPYSNGKSYQFGDLGPVYGVQWRQFGEKKVDQIQRIIDTLRTNPDDRRLLCMAWNPNDFDDMALPPCHYGFQFYTRELSAFERLEWLWDNSNGDYDEWKIASHEKLDELNVPRRELSLMWNQRSVDLFLGWSFNLVSYSLLLAMIAQCVNMSCGEVICNLGDVHIYENHFDAVRTQLGNDPTRYSLPQLWLNKNITSIDEFEIDDIKLIDYESYPTIKAPLSVG